MRSEQVRELFRRWQAANARPATELIYASPFQLLVSVVLSAQATDQAVNRATPALFAQAPNASAMAALGAQGIATHIRSIGLYHTKAKHLAALSQQLLERHQGEVPRERAALEALAGVGRKTANVVLNIVFGEPVIAVDTHIFRVAKRLGLATGTTPLAVERTLTKTVPHEFRYYAHHWLILHGRYVCKARQPLCASCAVADLCAQRF